ncbi:hypothetical protein [Pollutibacter soli]|uniref:hypothetical protein n=1 Tax=Pollutibacter soli TaxID=3034157 RepID=UPI003013BC1C
MSTKKQDEDKLSKTVVIRLNDQQKDLVESRFNDSVEKKTGANRAYFIRRKLLESLEK